MSKFTNPYLRRRYHSEALTTLESKREAIQSIIEAGMHGLCFSPYSEGQGPGTVLTKQQVKERLALVADNVSWVRSFSCTEGNELVPIVAKEMGLKTLVGVWLDGDFEANERELKGAFDLLEQGVVDMLAVGNEVMLREEMS